MFLGVGPDADLDDVRVAYRERIRVAHPDAGGDPRLAADLGAAFELLRARLAAGEPLPAGTVPSAPQPAEGRATGPVDTVEVACDGDTLFVTAPPHETFQLLLEAAATLGGIGHVDRHLGLLEVIVRFEGGPSCSVLFTLQGRAFGTDVFCTMESIEAASTPSIGPVMEALLDAFSRPVGT